MLQKELHVNIRISGEKKENPIILLLFHGFFLGGGGNIT